MARERDSTGKHAEIVALELGGASAVSADGEAGEGARTKFIGGRSKRLGIDPRMRPFIEALAEAILRDLEEKAR